MIGTGTLSEQSHLSLHYLQLHTNGNHWCSFTFSTLQPSCSSKGTGPHPPPLTRRPRSSTDGAHPSARRAHRKAAMAHSSRSRESALIHAQTLASSHPRSLRDPSRIHDLARPLPLMLPSSRSSSSRLFRAVFALQGRGFLDLGRLPGFGTSRGSCENLRFCEAV